MASQLLMEPEGQLETAVTAETMVVSLAVELSALQLASVMTLPVVLVMQRTFLPALVARHELMVDADVDLLRRHRRGEIRVSS